MDERIFNNRYRIENRLGDGGMAVVYSGTDVLLRRRVAIKVLREQYAADEDFVRRFYYEAQSAAKLSHPNIVNTYDVGRQDNAYFIVMELVDGATLAEMIAADKRLPEPVAIDYAAQICAGLAYAHRQGILHRDVKPANILVTKDDVVKLSDFGIARAVSQHTLSVTQPGMVMGSVSYLSPEQAQGLELSETSDLYSVGIVLYQMLSGQLPFTGETPVAVALKHVSATPPPLEAVVPDVSPALAAVVDRLLQKRPEDRFHSASEVASALREARDRPTVAVGGRRDATTVAMEAVAPPQPPPRPSRSPDRPTPRNGNATVAIEDDDEPATRRSNVPLILGLLAALILAAFAGYFFVGHPPSFGAKPLTMANFVGGDAAAAQKQLEAAGFTVRRTETTDEKIAADRVIKQSPDAGTAISPPGPVDLLVSTGLPVEVVPSVVGFSSADAQSALAQAGLRAQLVGQFSDKPKDSVIAQNPPKGAKLREHQNVRLVVSKGLAPVSVPNVVTQSLDAARAALAKAGLKVDVQQAASESVAANVVMSQDPKDGTQVDAGSTVTLVVSTGAQMLDVPDVMGKSYGDAVATLRAAGFTVTNSWSVQSGGNGTIIREVPSSGAKAPKGSGVTLTIAVPGLVPDVAGLPLDDAKATLQNAGYTVGNIALTQEGDEGKCVRTEPEAGKQLTPGEDAVVTLYCNLPGGAPPPAPPH